MKNEKPTYNNAYSLWRVNGYQQGFPSVASFGFGGQESASKPPQAICKLSLHLKMKNLLILILIIFTVSLSGYVGNNEVNPSLLFESRIGPENSKVKVQVYTLTTTDLRKSLLINLVNQGRVKFRDTLIVQMSDEPLIELIEVNGDGIKDLRVEYLRPGRGGNNVSIIYLYNSRNLRLEKISNSMNFPNLGYDQELKYVSSFRFYGGDGVQMDYLEIVSDSLLSRHRIIREGRMIYVKKNTDGKWIEGKELKLERNNIIIPDVLQLEPEVKIRNAS